MFSGYSNRYKWWNGFGTKIVKKLHQSPKQFTTKLLSQKGYSEKSTIEKKIKILPTKMLYIKMDIFTKNVFRKSAAYKYWNNFLTQK